MAKVLMETPGGKIITDDGTELEFRVAYDTQETSGIPWLFVHCYINDQFVGTPIRFKAASNRIAADFPNVSPTYFITEGGVDGPITNG